MGRIDTLHIENFRAIGSLDYAPRQLNIICGKNNTGKSALLDAISLNAKGGFPHSDDDVPQYNITFNKKYFIKNRSDKAAIISNINRVTLYSSLEKCRKDYPEHYRTISEFIIQTVLAEIDGTEDYKNQYLNTIFEGLDFIILLSDHGFRAMPYNKERQPDLEKKLLNIPGAEKGAMKIGKTSIDHQVFYYIGVISHVSEFQFTNNSQTENLQEVYTLSHKEKLSLEQMDDEEIHLLEQFIKEHNLVRNLERLTQNNILYRREGEIETIPISAHGDGFIALLSLFHYLRKSQDGILLIEEPENHLHPEYLAIFIETLFTYAPKLNVQVFMTTHSYDLIQTALDYPEDDAEKELLLISKMTSDGETIEKYDYTVEEGRRVTEELKLDLRGI